MSGRTSGARSRHADHYSYTAYADPRMAASFDAERFGGPVGRLVAELQEEVLLSFTAPVAGRSVLDVGTGTGRAAIALARAGARVTGVDPSPEMLAVAERRAADERLTITFRPGDVHVLEAADRAFDTVVCLRVLMHVPDWAAALSELCRVSSSRVVIDYPAACSAAALHSAARRVAHRLGARVEAYRVFSDGAIRSAFESSGFRVTAVHRQFVLPIALHKRVGSAAFTTRVERALSGLGLRALVGSPVTVAAERCAS